MKSKQIGDLNDGVGAGNNMAEFDKISTVSNSVHYPTGDANHNDS